MNVLTVTGNLGQDCRTNQVGGTAVCNFSVAAKSGHGDKEQTIWFDCALWGKRAESRLTDYLKKGQQVAVSGELSTRDHDGRTYLQLRVESITLIGGRDRQGGQPPAQHQPPHAAQQTGQTNGPTSFDDFDDEIPF